MSAAQRHEGRPCLRSAYPATGEVWGEFRGHSEDDLERMLDRARVAFEAHRHSSFAERAALMTRAAGVLERDKQDLATLATREMGKPIRGSLQEVEKCAAACRYFAAHAERFLADEQVEVGGLQAAIRFEPLGPVLAIMPWNFPFWQVFRFAAPALMAGNVAILKHASNVPQCAMAIERVFKEAGFTEGIFQTALIGSDQVAGLIADFRVRAATLTGSVDAGRRVAEAAGRALKKTVLELGGSDPFVVMASADIERCVEAAVQARIVNSGQSCIAAKRFIVDRRVLGEFQQRFVARMESLQVGDPMLLSTDVGPMATPDIVASLTEQVKRSVEMGARVLIGGGPLKGPGSYFAPTVLTDVPLDSPAAQEELFGPVAPLFCCDGIEEAMRLANATEFGLGACIWTNHAPEREQFVREVQAGVVFVNGMVASTPPLPFGGVKNSGYGRELSSAGIREFVNIKSVAVAQAATKPSETE